MVLAPIAVFAYKRPDHLRRTLEALSRCEFADRSRLFIFSDGPKTEAETGAVAEVRTLARSRAWCADVEVVEQECNRGLANSVMQGVTQLCDRFERVVVVEDDLVVSPNFLIYMNEALERYEDEPRVMQVSGYMFDVELDIEEDALFLPFVTSWGWGTWKRAWRYFDPNMRGFEELDRSTELRKKFNLGGAYDYFDQLQRQRAGLIDSWAIRWNLSVFQNNGLVLYPRRSLVQNIGFDGSGTHTRGENDPEASSTVEIVHFPATVRESSEYTPILRYLDQRTKRRRLRRAIGTAIRPLRQLFLRR